MNIAVESALLVFLAELLKISQNVTFVKFCVVEIKSLDLCFRLALEIKSWFFFIFEI